MMSLIVVLLSDCPSPLRTTVSVQPSNKTRLFKAQMSVCGSSLLRQQI